MGAMCASMSNTKTHDAHMRDKLRHAWMDKAEVERQRPRAVLRDTCMHTSRPWRIGADMLRGIVRVPACRILPRLCSGGLHDMTAARNQGVCSCGEVRRS